MADHRTAFRTPIATHGLAGFPEALRSVAEARAAIEAARLPAIRSGYAWLQAHNRLTDALVTRASAHIEAARLALAAAIADERRRSRGQGSEESLRIAA